MQNIYNGFVFFGETGITGSHWLPGMWRKSLKTLFTFMGRTYGLIAVMRRSAWEYDTDALDSLNHHFPVFIEGFSDIGDLVCSDRWSGVYPVKQSGLTYLVRVKNSAGHSVGDVERGLMLKAVGIEPEIASPDDRVCSIGFCAQKQKWYGWSHRAMCGFAIGDVAKDGDCVCTSIWSQEEKDQWSAENTVVDLGFEDTESYLLPVGFTAVTIEDCKTMAIAFADSVG
jgi:hypothetical protein